MEYFKYSVTWMCLDLFNYLHMVGHLDCVKVELLYMALHIHMQVFEQT